MAKIVIFGITGYAGRAIASELLDRGHHVVGIARQPEAVTARADLEVRAGSVYDSSLVQEVAPGADAILLAIRVLPADDIELAPAIPMLLKTAEASGERIGVVGASASLFVVEGGARVIDAGFPAQYRAEAEARGRVLDALPAAATTVDEPAHHQAHFMLGY
jgi:uncharacterized protein